MTHLTDSIRNRIYGAILLVVAGLLLFVGCGEKETQEPEPVAVVDESADANALETEVSIEEIEDIDPADLYINEWLETHTLEEKVQQMFMLTMDDWAAQEDQPAVGGLIYFSDNLEFMYQTMSFLSKTETYFDNLGYTRPFLSVDEEGGTVTRISGRLEYGVGKIKSMQEIGKTGDRQEAYDLGVTIGEALKDLGFNMDMAPVADVLTNPKNTVIGSRSFGSDAQLVGDMVVSEIDGLTSQGIIPVIKHFPGHGATMADTHEGYAYTMKSMDELRNCELRPFQRAIRAGAQVVLVSHISTPKAINENVPASLSYEWLTTVLREEMEFDGIIMTDAMNMGAITLKYSAAEAAVKAVCAGVDMILMPENYKEAYEGLLVAIVDNHEIDESRIDDSVRRILRVKITSGVIDITGGETPD